MRLLENTLKGNIVSAAQLITVVENNPELTSGIEEELKPHIGRAHIIGVTGPPGAGKSTLISEIIDVYIKENKKVAVLAVDSSSPFTGGAVLGDRIRMQKCMVKNNNVFIRSMATRGALGGVAKATRCSTYIMDALGSDIIIVETVGVGQTEVEIANIAHTVILVLTPGMGDAVQAMKAGILEIADIFVLNKADREGADVAIGDIQYMLSIIPRNGKYEKEIFKTEAVNGKGIPELIEGLKKHRQFLTDFSPT